MHIPCSSFLLRHAQNPQPGVLSSCGWVGLRNADGQDDFAVCLLPVAAGADACGADEVELVVNGVQEHAHVAQDERAELAPLRRFGREPRIDVLLRFRDRPLSLDDQGRFIVGYAQQYRDLYTKKSKDKPEENSEVKPEAKSEE